MICVGRHSLLRKNYLAPLFCCNYDSIFNAITISLNGTYHPGSLNWHKLTHFGSLFYYNLMSLPTFLYWVLILHSKSHFSHFCAYVQHLRVNQTDLNGRLQVTEATTLPTVPQPLSTTRERFPSLLRRES